MEENSLEYENDTLELGFSVFVISSQADEFESNVNNSGCR